MYANWKQAGQGVVDLSYYISNSVRRCAAESAVGSVNILQATLCISKSTEHKRVYLSVCATMFNLSTLNRPACLLSLPVCRNEYSSAGLAGRSSLKAVAFRGPFTLTEACLSKMREADCTPFIAKTFHRFQGGLLHNWSIGKVIGRNSLPLKVPTDSNGHNKGWFTIETYQRCPWIAFRICERQTIDLSWNKRCLVSVNKSWKKGINWKLSRWYCSVLINWPRFYKLRSLNVATSTWLLRHQSGLF